MSKENIAAVSAFVEGAPPGELSNIIADVKGLTLEGSKLLQSASPAFEKYNEDQFSVVKLPGAIQSVLVTSYNSLGAGRYYDVESKSSFAFDHVTQKASAVQSYVLESQHTDLINSLLKSLSIYAQEHYTGPTYSIFPLPKDPSTLALVLVANKYSPSNFWNGRWRSVYLCNPSSGSLTGTIQVVVHYYEDGNVRLTTKKAVTVGSVGFGRAEEVVRKIGEEEKKYQGELNRGFEALSEGAFKGLRRQLPVTRQKVEWEKIGSYRLGQDIGGRRSR
ncbi:MAG: F-actin-capping protein subunit alpha [Icmadophila ericetorum]|nr:F-actin-capping protein subunit alpha [Icmadophila ericetorum]